jgi:hypothetical protein
MVSMSLLEIANDIHAALGREPQHSEGREQKNDQ